MGEGGLGEGQSGSIPLPGGLECGPSSGLSWAGMRSYVTPSMNRITKTSSHHPRFLYGWARPGQAKQARALNLVILATSSPMGKKGYRSQLVLLESPPSSPEPPWKDPQDILKQGSNKGTKGRGGRDLDCVCTHRLRHEVRMGAPSSSLFQDTSLGRYPRLVRMAAWLSLLCDECRVIRLFITPSQRLQSHFATISQCPLRGEDELFSSP